LSVTTVVVHVGAVKIFVPAAVEVFRKKERGDETQFTTKIGGKTCLGSFPVTHLMLYYAETDCSHPLNHLTFY